MAILLNLAPFTALRAQQVWLDALSTQKDWNQLFTTSPQWAAVARRLDVYSTSNEYIERATNADVTKLASDLAARHVALAIDLQSVERGLNETCGAVEGYSLLRENSAGAAKLHRLDAGPSLIVLDEPLWFGHFDPEKNACRFPVLDLVHRVAASVRAYLALFPNAMVGDIEPIPGLSARPGWQRAYRDFSSHLAAEIGRPVSFLQLDVSWRTAGWLAAVQEARSLAASLKQGLGIIYNGDGPEKTGTAWVSDAIDHFQAVETRGGIIPAQAIFQTWNDQPRTVFPETDPASLSHVLAVYQRPRTKLMAQRSGSAFHGKFVDAKGRAVAGAPVSLKTIGSVASQPPPARVIVGAVPPKARFGIIGLRVNDECFCAGANDLLLGPLTYAEAGAQPPVETFSVVQAIQARNGQPWPGTEVHVLQIKGAPYAHMIVGAKQPVLLNSPEFPVTPDAGFAFRAPIGSLDGGGLFGSVTLVWLNADHQGFARENIIFARDTSVVAHAATDSHGKFTLPIPSAENGISRTFRVIAAPTTRARGAELDLR